MISVIIPVYNTGYRLNKCVASFCQQTYREIEILLVDDGSDDETAAICDQLAKKYKLVTTYHFENAGVSEARNRGIELANGKFLFFADGDDYVEPQMLNDMMQIYYQKKVDLIVCGYYYELSNGSRVKQSISDIYLCNREKVILKMVELWDSAMMYNVWNKLFLRKPIVEHGIKFPQGKAFNEDRDFIREYLLFVNSIYVSENAYYHYLRENEITATGKYREDMLQIRKEEYHLLIDFFKKIGNWNMQSEEYVSREHCDRVVGTIENIFHGKLVDKKEIKNKINKIVNDSDTQICLKKAAPKSIKMRLLYGIINTGSTELIYWVMRTIYRIRSGNPKLFYILRKSR